MDGRPALDSYVRRVRGRSELQVGLIMVIGLSNKNAILIVEFAKEEYERGASLVETGARVRLRRILMTVHAWRRLEIRQEASAMAVVASIVRESPSRLRRNSRARCTRVFTTATLSPRAVAISRCDRPSTSRSTTTVR